MIDFIKRQARNEANKAHLSTPSMLSLVLVGLWILPQIPYSILEIYCESYLIADKFESISPEKVVSQWVVTSESSDNPSIRMITSSGTQFDIGIYLPNFEGLKRAVESNKELRVWSYKFELKPKLLADYVMGSEPRLYQIESNGEMVVPFDLMLESNQEGAPFMYMLATMLLALIFALTVVIWAILIRLQDKRKVVTDSNS